MDNRIYGRVVWYDHRDGNGVVEDQAGNAYYIDDSVLECDPMWLRSGVEVTWYKNHKIKDCPCGHMVNLHISLPRGIH